MIFRVPSSWSKPLSRKQIFMGFFGASVYFVPLIALVVFPENPVVEFLFGGYRLLVFYVVAISAIVWLERALIFGREEQEKDN